MSILRKLDGEYNRYWPQTELTGKVSELFDEVTFTNSRDYAGVNPDSELIYLNLEGKYNGTIVNVKPCKELKELMARNGIFGWPRHGEVSLECSDYEQLAILRMKFQQISGSYALVRLTPEQYQELLTLTEH